MGDNIGWTTSGSPGSPPPNWSIPPAPPAPPDQPGTPWAPPESGGPKSKGRHRGRTFRTLAIATVSAGALALVGVSVASAQSSPTTTTPSTAPSATPSTSAPGTTKPALPEGPGGQRGFRGGFGFPGFGGPGGFGGGGSIHGTFVRPNGTGYETVDTQVGVVQAGLTGALIEVKSADGFDQKYSVTANTVVNSGRDGIGSVKVGDTVSVEAVGTGTPEAASIVDTTTLGGIRNHWRPAAPPAPATTPTTTG